MTDPHAESARPEMQRIEGIEGWVSCPLPVLGQGPDASYWSVCCSSCHWSNQGYGAVEHAIGALNSHRQDKHSDGTARAQEEGGR